MANIGTATIKITPEFDSEVLALLDDTLREAIATSLRRLADELTAKPKPAVSKDTPASPEPALWGYNIGDRVHYAGSLFDAVPEVRIVAAIKEDHTGTQYLSLNAEDGEQSVGTAYRPTEIRPA